MGGITLLPCPFCGGDAELIDDGKHSFVFCIDEEECGVEGYRALDEGYAIEAWNRRVNASSSPTLPNADELEVVADGSGWVFWNPDSGEEYYPDHPVESGVCEDAERIRRSTSQEDVLWTAMQGYFTTLSSAQAQIERLTRERDEANAGWEH